MYNTTSAFHPFFIEGYTSAFLPIHILEAIRAEIVDMTEDESRAVPYNEDLAGDLEYEFAIKKTAPLIEPFLNDMAKEFWSFHNSANLSSSNFKIACNNNPNKPYDIWVNFQRKGEYNPLHTHSGVLSFVVYIQVPFSFEEENKSTKSNTKTRGSFKFIYPQRSKLGEQHAPTGSSVSVIMLPVDKTWVGKVIMFKADQPHLVEPFYSSDDYRISVAGNLVLA